MPVVTTPRSLDLAHLRTALWFHEREPLTRVVTLDETLGALYEARKKGCKRACLEVRPSNRSARKMYENLGFRETDMRRGYYSDTGEDALVLTADLSTA